MHAVLQPLSNLMFSRRYRITVTRGITDAVGNSAAICASQETPLGEGCLLPLDREYTATFNTKQPAVYELTGDTFTGGRGIDLYTDRDTRKTYAYVAAGKYDAPRSFPTFETGHAEMLLCDAIAASARERRWIPVSC